MRKRFTSVSFILVLFRRNKIRRRHQRKSQLLCFQSEDYCCEQRTEEAVIDLDIAMTFEKTKKKKETYGEEVGDLFCYVVL